MPVAAEIDERLRRGEAARGSVGAHLATIGEEFASIGVQLGARYDGSPIIAGRRRAARRRLVDYTPSGVPGGRAPHFWLGTGAESAIRCSTGSARVHAAGSGRGRRRPMPCSPLQRRRAVCRLPGWTIEEAYARDLYQRDFVIVRPDRHVAWRGDDIPRDPGALLDPIDRPLTKPKKGRDTWPT